MAKMVTRPGKNHVAGHLMMRHGYHPMLITSSASQHHFNHHLRQVMKSLDTICGIKVGFILDYTVKTHLIMSVLSPNLVQGPLDSGPCNLTIIRI